MTGTEKMHKKTPQNILAITIYGEIERKKYNILVRRHRLMSNKK